MFSRVLFFFFAVAAFDKSFWGMKAPFQLSAWKGDFLENLG